jgi:hypothetical protein
MMGPANNPATAAQKPTNNAAPTAAAERQPMLQLQHATASCIYAATTHHFLQLQDI